MATAVLTPAEQAQADAAMARLRAQGRVGGRFPQVTRRPSLENPTIFNEVITSIGPGGNGRIVIVEKQVGNILARKNEVDGVVAGHTTRDWRDINLSEL